MLGAQHRYGTLARPHTPARTRTRAQDRSGGLMPTAIGVLLLLCPYPDSVVMCCTAQEAERSRAEAELASSWAVASVHAAQESAVRSSVRSRLR
jgi:hypothetical protein